VTVLRPLPGNGLLARYGDLVLLCEADDARLPALLDAVAEVAAAGGDGRRLGRRLAGLLSAAGLDDADEYPALCAFGPSGGGLAVLVHGAAVVEAVAARQQIRLDGATAVTWVDRVLVGPVESVRAGLAGADISATPDRWARLDGGVVRAGGLVFRAGVAPVPVPPVEVPAPVDELEQTMAAGLDELDDETDAAVAIEPGAAPEPSPAPYAAEPSRAPYAAEPPPAPFPPPVAAPSPVVVPLPPAPAPVSPAAPIPGSPVPVRIDRSAPFESVLLVGAAPLEAAPPLPRADEPAPAADGAPVVLGIYCTNDHFNDPRAPYCAVCGISMVQATHVSRPGPRPPLGVLVLDDGATFRLDTPYVVGREPERDAEVVGGRARALRIADRDGVVSRIHARVHLDGWDVHVVDLGSSNGTHICEQGTDTWIRIPSQTPVPIRPGTRVLFGRRGFRYESHRNP